MSTVAPGLMAAKSLSQFLFLFLPVFYDACARTYWYTVVADIPLPRTSLGGAASPLPRPRSVVREGCVGRGVSGNGNFDEKDEKKRVMTEKVLLS